MTLSPKLAGSIVNRKITLSKQKWQERLDWFFDEMRGENALKSKKKWLRWHFSPPQKAKIRGVKGRMKGVKQGIS